jgi:hypothetical protein
MAVIAIPVVSNLFKRNGNKYVRKPILLQWASEHPRPERWPKSHSEK